MTNIVHIFVKDSSINCKDYQMKFESEEIRLLTNDIGFRLVVYRSITQDDIKFAIQIFNQLFPSAPGV